MRVLLIVPPFGSVDRPNLGVHLLQSCARDRGHEVEILYSNIVFAALLGEVPYMTITGSSIQAMMGERVMGLPTGAILPPEALQKLNEEILHEAKVRGLVPTEPLTLEFLQGAIDALLEETAEAIVRRPYDVIGFSSTFEQTNGLALLAKKCRAVLPNVTLVAGGANCEGKMAPAMKRFAPELDFVFSGESEHSFADFLDDPERFAGQSIIDSPPNPDLNSLPPLDFDEFFTQLDARLPESWLRRTGGIQLPYESSRGCWWGQKNHCTFCGLNGQGMGYREKKPELVMTEIADLVGATGLRNFSMTDNIMPFSYFTSLIPKLIEADMGLDIFYEQKANISFEKILALKTAGVSRIQPGIESLQDDLLRLMKKGTSGKQNIALLRYVRSLNISTAWNLLSGFPGDREEWYEEMLRLVPLIVHLEPPTGVSKLNFDRFSPYYDRAADYGITGLRPLSGYHEAFPNCDYLSELAYHFIGDCDGHTVDNSEAVRKLTAAVKDWRALWDCSDGEKAIPCLEVIEIDSENYLLIDSRPQLDVPFMQQLTADQASVALSFHNEESALTRWGEERGVCVRERNGYFPLACAAPEVLLRFEGIRAPNLQDAPV